MAMRKTLSNSQRASRRRATSKATADRRRQLYAEDPNYREAAKQTSRTAYRERSGLTPRNIRNAEEFAATIDAIGTMRVIHGTGNAKEQLSLSVRELANALGGYHPNVVRQWCREGRFPAPTHDAVCAGKMPVYTKAQALALMQVMSKHQKKKAYLSATDTDTITLLFSAMKA